MIEMTASMHFAPSAAIIEDFMTEDLSSMIQTLRINLKVKQGFGVSCCIATIVTFQCGSVHRHNEIDINYESLVLSLLGVHLVVPVTGMKFARYLCVSLKKSFALLFTGLCFRKRKCLCAWAN